MALDLEGILLARDPGRSRSRRRKRERKLLGVKPPAPPERQFRKDLDAIVFLMATAVQEHLIPVLMENESQFFRGAMADAFGDEIDRAMRVIRAQFTELEAYAYAKATGLIDRMDREHQIRYFKQVQQATGIDLQGVVARERLDDVLQAKLRENVGLIKSIPEQYFGRIESLVYEGAITGRTSASSLAAEIFALGAKTKRRAALIARDQTAKLNAAMNEERNLALGVREYIWETSRDERVRDTHRHHQGRKYKFGTAPGDDGHPGKTGHPGQDINCRCTARPIIPGL